MTDIDVEMARILSATRGAHDPSPRDEKRIRLALAGALGGIGASAVTGTSAAASTAAASTAAIATSSAGLVKIAAMGLLIGSATGSAGWAVLDVLTRSPAAKAPAAFAAPQGSSRVHVTTQRRVPPTPGLATKVEVLEVAPPASVTARVRSGSATTNVASRNELAEEVAAFRRAQEQLERDPELALRQLDAMDATHPNGALNEEAQVARVIAYCKVGQVEHARRAAARFFVRYPGSVHAVRLRASCAVGPTNPAMQSSQSSTGADGSELNPAMNESNTQSEGKP